MIYNDKTTTNNQHTNNKAANSKKLKQTTVNGCMYVMNEKHDMNERYSILALIYLIVLAKL